MISLKKKRIAVGLLLIFVIVFQSCSKEPGSGGSSGIYGKVYVRDYDEFFTTLHEEYYGQEIDVYLIYGDDRSYSDQVKTNYDGSFEFKYLRPGEYHLFCYSEDSTLQTRALIPVIRDVTISRNKESIEVEDITIFK
ncbi:MAG: hypothetical protein IPH84_10915 [Bacteroidales bacterium]|nr:hypothetical protein [Bacteroidales bacterium]